MPPVLYSADVVCPMTGPPLPEGGVLVVDDRVAAVGDARSLRREAMREHRVDGVLLPGLVNAHTHLELTAAAELASPGPFHIWTRAVAGMTGRWDDRVWTRSARRGVLASLRAGVTCVGDTVTRGPGVPAAARAGLVGDSWVEVVDVDVSEHDAVIAAVTHSLGLPAPGRRVGIGSAGPHTLGIGVLQGLAALAAARDVPLQMHAAVSQAEVRAIWHGDGPLAELAHERRLEFEWLDEGTGLGPMRYLAQCGALTPRASVVGAVWVDDAEAQLLAERAVPVVCCPRSNTLLGAGDAPLERYARAGVRLALGTESAAAVPNLDVLDEAAAWVRLARRRELVLWPSPVGPVELEEQAVRLLTVDGAAAMGWGGVAGVLEPGRRADFVGVDVATSAATVYRDLIEHGPGRQVLTVLGGVRTARRGDADAAWPELEGPSDAP